nr:type II secretion system protein [Tissierella sp.]
MKNRKGMTLIEVILSLVLLSIIAIVFLPSATNSIKLMTGSKNLTITMFDKQKQIEENINSVKKEINEREIDSNINTIKGLEIKSSTLYFKIGNSNRKVTIKGVLVNDIDELKNNKINKDKNKKAQLFNFVPDIKKPKDVKFPDLDVTIELNEENRRYKESNSDYERININEDPITLNGKTEKIGEYDVFSYNMDKSWYITKNEYVGSVSPSFPKDYKLIKKYKRASAIDSKLDIESNSEIYKNRLIAFSVTQISKYGRYEEITSQPIHLVDEVVEDVTPIINRIYDNKKENDHFLISSSDKLEGTALKSIPKNSEKKWYEIKDWHNKSYLGLSTKIDGYSEINGFNPEDLKNHKGSLIKYSIMISGKQFFSHPVLVVDETKAYNLQLGDSEFYADVSQSTGIHSLDKNYLITYGKNDKSNQKFYFMGADKGYFNIKMNNKYIYSVDSGSKEVSVRKLTVDNSISNKIADFKIELNLLNDKYYIRIKSGDKYLNNTIGDRYRYVLLIKPGENLSNEFKKTEGENLWQLIPTK